MIAGARNVIFFNTKCSWSSKSNLGCEAGCGLTVSWSDHSRIMVRSCSDRSRIVNDVSAVFEKFVRNFGEPFCVAGAAFGDV